jgi:RNA-directed DNA polymerase
VLNTIYETDFLGFSYGFRPGRSQHQAPDALYTGLLTRKVNWVLDMDIKGFFDGISHEWLVKFVEHRIADRRVVRLIQKWLKAGVLEDGKRIRVEEGTPQGGSASPLLANVYLHYVFDLWVQAWRQKRKWLQAVVRGHIRYYGVPLNYNALWLFRSQVGRLWHRALSRRSQNGRVLWDRMRRLITRWLPNAYHLSSLSPAPHVRIHGGGCV